MSTEVVLKYALILHISLSVATVCVLVSRRAARDFPAFCCLLMTNIVSGATTLLALYYRNAAHLALLPAYHLFYWSSWATDLLSLILTILIIYAVFTEAMRPFPGLQRVGSIIFRWVGAASFVVAIALAMGPQVFAKDISALAIAQELISRLLQGVNVLILCLLIFVCFAIRPLGLTFRSRVFGVTLGLAVASTVQLIEVAWTAIAGVRSLYSPVFAFGVFGGWLFPFGSRTSPCLSRSAA